MFQATDEEMRWLSSGNTGISSMTIWMVMTGAPGIPGWHFGPDVPHDPSDFWRCRSLLQVFPEWRSRLQEVADRFPIWGPMVREWDRMEELYVRDAPTGKSMELWRLMQKLEDEGRSILSGHRAHESDAQQRGGSDEG